MTTQQFIIYIAVVFIGLFFYNTWQARNRVYCRFTRKDRSTGKKWAKFKNGERLEWEGGWYYVDTDRIIFDTIYFGLVGVRVLEYKKGVSNPRNPRTGDYGWESAEARKNLNKREDIEALELGSQKALGKAKVPILGGGWLPIILVVGIVACFYFIWQQNSKIDMVGMGQNVIEQMLGDIQSRLP